MPTFKSLSEGRIKTLVSTATRPLKKAGPTDDEFETCMEVLSWLEQWYIENEPTATEAIAVFHEAYMQCPDSLDDL